MPMMIPVPTFTDGNYVHQADLNNLSTNIDTLCQQTTGKTAATAGSTKPICKLTLSGSQAIASGLGGTNQIVIWGTQIVNTDNMWSAAQPDHIIIRTPGWYRIRAQAMWAAGGGGPASSERVVQILVNGSLDPLNVTATTSTNMAGGNTAPMVHQVMTVERLAAGASIFVGVFQHTGLNLNLLTNGAWGTHVTAAWEAPF